MNTRTPVDPDFRNGNWAIESNSIPPTSPHHQGEAILQGAPSKGFLKPTRFGDDPNTKTCRVCGVYVFFESILVRSFLKRQCKLWHFHAF